MILQNSSTKLVYQTQLTKLIYQINLPNLSYQTCRPNLSTKLLYQTRLIFQICLLFNQTHLPNSSDQTHLPNMSTKLISIMHHTKLIFRTCLPNSFLPNLSTNFIYITRLLLMLCTWLLCYWFFFISFFLKVLVDKSMCHNLYKIFERKQNFMIFAYSFKANFLVNVAKLLLNFEKFG